MMILEVNRSHSDASWRERERERINCILLARIPSVISLCKSSVVVFSYKLSLNGSEKQRKNCFEKNKDDKDDDNRDDDVFFLLHISIFWEEDISNIFEEA